MANKHAYLIMAHNNPTILRKLLRLIDDKNNDVFLHIDVGASLDIDISKDVRISKVYIVEPIKVFWADFSQVEATYRLLEKAHSINTYSYYHLLSGNDLPIKPVDEIYNFFESSGKNFIGIVPNEVYYSVRRVKFYHPFLHNNYYRRFKVMKILDRLFEYGQSLVGINRLKNSSWSIIDGWTWFSIRNEFCEYVISQKEAVNTMFTNTIASDELFMQTLAFNSKYYATLYDTTDLKSGSMRYIDWQRGKPYTWGNDISDYDILMKAPYMFARKFDESQMWLVNKIYDDLIKNRGCVAHDKEGITND